MLRNLEMVMIHIPDPIEATTIVLGTEGLSGDLILQVPEATSTNAVW